MVGIFRTPGHVISHINLINTLSLDNTEVGLGEEKVNLHYIFDTK